MRTFDLNFLIWKLFILDWNLENYFILRVINFCKLWIFVQYANLTVNSVSSSTAEITFSMARKVKTWMWSTMSPALSIAVSSTVLIMSFIGFAILSYPIRSKIRSIGYNKTYAKPSHSNLLLTFIQTIKTYGSNMLPMKALIFKSRFSFKYRKHGKH